MSDLFLNPITIIASLLAAFFIIMAFVRHSITKRTRGGRRASDRPNRVADPYTLPPPAPPPAPSPTLQTPAHPSTDAKPPAKIFRQFGHPQPTSGGTTSAPSDYIWE